MELLRWLLDARLEVAGSAVLWREVVGNVFGLASARGVMSAGDRSPVLPCPPSLHPRFSIQANAESSAQP